MNPERWKQICEVFAQAVEREESQRAAYLDEVCGEDAELKAEVQKLLAADDPESSFLDVRPGDQETVETDRAEGASLNRPVARGMPEIEGYEITRELHRGGQGVVYQALQRSTKRKVAIKLLLHGAHATKTAKKRFEREIELVAQLKHPNIISIFDSGSTTDGLPFYVMDYVRGRPLHTHVREHGLTLEEALKLFNQVCEAVQYAHQRGVIHRDLKPTNILVDEDGHPKILDFGLAKFVSAPVETVVSMTQEVVGTLPYMSPEQAKGNPDQIDTRTDVYSLGVILYELLTGHYPYPVAGQIAEVLRNIMETAPTPPTKSWKPDSGVGGRSAHRFGSGDCPIDDEVQTIVLKALSKELVRRYQSAGELARDVEHYLLGEPIEAKRDSGWYLLRKHVARHRTKITVAVAVVLALAGTYGIIRSVQKGREQARKEVEQRARALVQQGIDHDFLDEWEKATQSLEEALKEDPDYWAAWGNLARVMIHRHARRKSAEADPSLLDQAIDYAKRAAEFAPPGKAGPWNNMCVALMLRGRYDEAETACRKAIEIDPGFFAAFANLAKVLASQQKFEEAREVATATINVATEAGKKSNRWAGDGWRTLATIQMLLRQGDPLDSLNHSLACDRQTCWTYLGRARFYLEDEQRGGVRLALNDAIVADAISNTNDGRIKRVLALVLLRVGGRDEEAIRYADQAINNGDLAAPNHFIAAIAYARLGNVPKSHERFDEGVAAWPDEFDQAEFIVNADRQSLWYDSREGLEKLRDQAKAMLNPTP